MLGIYVSVPIACFRKGVAREFLETERVPPPATCYGFLLSMVGETNRRRHIGSRVSPVLVSNPSKASCCGPSGALKKRHLALQVIPVRITNNCYPGSKLSFGLILATSTNRATLWSNASAVRSIRS